MLVASTGEGGGGDGGESIGGITEDGGGGGGLANLGSNLANPSNNNAGRSNSNKETTVPRHQQQINNNQQQQQQQQKGSRKNHRRCRRQKFLPHLYHAHNSKRIRRNTQPAPNNTNEFLMEDHDQLFHLDFADMCNSEGHHHRDPVCKLHSSKSGAGGPSDDKGLLIATSNNNSDHPAFHYSSSEDDDDYLNREFSATYDTVNAERISSMSKSELVTEYQMLQERVETLERRLKITQGEGGGGGDASLCQSCGLQSNVSQSNNPVRIKYGSDS